jgi:prolipoprotein diacylglyceryltransferase
MIDRKAADRVRIWNVAAFAAMVAIFVFIYLAEPGPLYQSRRPREAMALCVLSGIVIGGRVVRLLCGEVTRNQFEEMRGRSDDRLVEPDPERVEDG